MPPASSDRDLLLAELTACAAHPTVAAGRRGIEVYAALLASRHAFLEEATGHDPLYARLTAGHRPDEDGDCVGCLDNGGLLDGRWPCEQVVDLADDEGVDLVRKTRRPRLKLVTTRHGDP